jgi:hypothetical protein
MPFKSEAQRRLFWAKVGRGEISRGTAEEWESATPKGRLPEHVKKGAMTKTAEPPPPPGVSVREWDERLSGDTPLTDGGKVELEHADTIRRIKEDPSMTVAEAADMIADDHEEEHKGYYPALKRMEAQLEQTKKAAFWDELAKIGAAA